MTTPTAATAAAADKAASSRQPNAACLVKQWKRRQCTALVRECCAELLGTFLLLLIGCGSNVQALASPGGNSTSNHLAWGFGFAFAVYTSIHISGAHLNPAMSFTAWLLGKLSVERFILYSLSQLLGAFLGAAVAFIGHYDDIRTFDRGLRQVHGPLATAQCFATFPPAHLSVLGNVIDQIIGTAILSGVLSLLTDRRLKTPIHLVPLLGGLLITMIAMSFGDAGSFALNPARDLGPRLFTLAAGYGWQVFSYNSYSYFWIPIVAPFVGALLGAVFYRLSIGIAHEEKDELEKACCCCSSSSESAPSSSSHLSIDVLPTTSPRIVVDLKSTPNRAD